MACRSGRQEGLPTQTMTNGDTQTEGVAENDVRCVRIASPLTSATWRALVMCLSRTARGSLYFASTAVVMCEALKLAVLMLLADPHAPQILCQKVRSLHTRNDIFPSPALLSA